MDERVWFSGLEATFHKVQGPKSLPDLPDILQILEKQFSFIVNTSCPNESSQALEPRLLLSPPCLSAEMKAFLDEVSY